jgi:hypothetical protein
VLAEKVSVAAARDFYGVAIAGWGFSIAIDAAETAKLRGVTHAPG